MNKIKNYLEETEEEFGKIVTHNEKLRKVIGVSHNCKCNFEEIRNLLESRQLGLIELVRSLVPKREENFSFDIYVTGKGAKEKNDLYDAKWKGFDEGFEFCRSQILKNLELKDN